MRLPRSLMPLLLSGMLISMLPFNSIAQSGTATIEADSTDAVESPVTSRHSLFTGFGYGSNMIWLGSTISQNQPFGYGALTYGFNNEFYATVSAVHLAEMKPFMAFYSGSLNYNHVFNKWLDISTGIYRYQTASSLSDTLFSSFTYADATMGFDWKLIYTRISFGGLISRENQVYFQLRNSRYFQTPDLLKGKVSISFDPYINLLFGTLTKVETIEGTSKALVPPFIQWRFANQSTTTTVYTRTFGMIEMDFGLPVAFNTDLFTIEVETGYILPVYKDSEYPGPKGFVLLLSGYFRIF
jgi:hypothetical protein